MSSAELRSAEKAKQIFGEKLKYNEKKQQIGDDKRKYRNGKKEKLEDNVNVGYFSYFNQFQIKFNYWIAYNLVVYR